MVKRFAFLFCTGILLAGCQTTPTVDPDPTILRVGITPRSKPMVFKENGQIMGIEADFAQQLGKALNRQVVFVEVPWEKQIDYLEANKTDIIMSNMSITGPRRIRINFSIPYLQSGQSALFRRGQHDPRGLTGSVILNQAKRVGFVKDTTGEFFCVQRFNRATLSGFDNINAGIDALIKNQIDMFVHDAPVIWWRSAMHERELVAFPEVLNVEPIAWGVGKHNMMLLDDVNALISKWEKDGTAERIVQNWIPNFSR